MSTQNLVIMKAARICLLLVNKRVMSSAILTAKPTNWHALTILSPSPSPLAQSSSFSSQTILASLWWVGLRLVLLIMAPTNTGMGIFNFLGLSTKFCFMAWAIKPKAPHFPFSFHWYNTPCCLHTTERDMGQLLHCLWFVMLDSCCGTLLWICSLFYWQHYLNFHSWGLLVKLVSLLALGLPSGGATCH